MGGGKLVDGQGASTRAENVSHGEGVGGWVGGVRLVMNNTARGPYGGGWA